MKLVLTGVFRGELFGGASEVLGEPRDVVHVAPDGFGGQVPQLHVLDQAFSQRSHGAPSAGGNRDRPRSVSIMRGAPGSAPDRIIATTGTSGLQATWPERHSAVDSGRSGSRNATPSRLFARRSRALSTSAERFSSTSEQPDSFHRSASGDGKVTSRLPGRQ